jgi:hypothetical protein
MEEEKVHRRNGGKQHLRLIYEQVAAVEMILWAASNMNKLDTK